MPKINDSATWAADVYQIQTTDPVLGDSVDGAADGPLNKAAKNLADRTAWLKEHSGLAEKYSDRVLITANTTIDETYVGKQIRVVATGNITLTIASAEVFEQFSLLHFRVTCVPNKCVKIVFTGGQLVETGSDGNRSKIILLDGEFLTLETLPDSFEIAQVSSSFHEVGHCVSGYASHRNCAVRNGQLVSRADHARVWDWIERNIASGAWTDGHEIVTEAVWVSSQVITVDGVNITIYPYKGCFSKGDGASTFRYPDDRGMFDRYLDMGRGVSSDRVWDYAGGYQHQQVQQHKHKLPPVYGESGTGLKVASGNPASFEGDGNNFTDNTGGNETRPRNNAKIPLIKQ